MKTISNSIRIEQQLEDLGVTLLYRKFAEMIDPVEVDHVDDGPVHYLFKIAAPIVGLNR